ncbi:MAG: cation diffusion facilitator family transporter [Rhodobacter sp.]|uniref:cation diffusion facilitator family transporter n=1 Tax=Pararhodobacter sp. TaxID=2127056 RepID=UPI001D63AEC7|nr:cation diffusion facilitator family transporter [Pararhodobacter sp.]MCB1345315.1 cation diffusion facilitator family transporter [Paracoccaceae bacterium]MCB1408167.1 cation diffusion facilitator family transporter [Paracoccaceae bacterium]MCC0072538.1 cation diffusion facilitator family transporter [Rhodobacter sp.]HPD93008.1 cation diffusion facilitator family transporter [Pararhodobacter sp.]
MKTVAAIPDSRHSRRLNLSAGVASVAVAVTLVVLKLWALVMTGALSVAASLADNALDVMVSVAALAAIGYATRPADEDHTFGHTSAEDLAALLQSALVLISAGMIGVLAALRLFAAEPAPVQAEGWGIAVMAVSVVLTGALVLWQRHVAKATGNRVVAADSLHYLGDLLPTLGVLVALGASSLWGLARVDSVIALLAALWLARSGASIGRGAWDALMDHAAPPEVLDQVHAIANDWPGLKGHHDLRTRMAGSRTFIGLHVELDGEMSLNEAHRIADGLEHKLESMIPDSDVIIHLDPVGPGSGRVARG